MVGQDKRRVKNAVSSGGVVYREHNGTPETVLCGRNEPVRWSLAKGTPDPGETLEETALREVTLIREPVGDEAGYWAGAPGWVWDETDQATYLTYRIRRPRGVEPDRGGDSRAHALKAMAGVGRCPGACGCSYPPMC